MGETMNKGHYIVYDEIYIPSIRLKKTIIWRDEKKIKKLLEEIELPEEGDCKVVEQKELNLDVGGKQSKIIIETYVCNVEDKHEEDDELIEREDEDYNEEEDEDFDVEDYYDEDENYDEYHEDEEDYNESESYDEEDDEYYNEEYEEDEEDEDEFEYARLLDEIYEDLREEEDEQFEDPEETMKELEERLKRKLNKHREEELEEE